MLTKKAGNYFYDGILIGSKPSIPSFYRDYVKEKPSYDFRLYIMLKSNKNFVHLNELLYLSAPIDSIIIDGKEIYKSSNSWIEITEIKTKLNTEDYPGPQVETIFIGRRI